MTKYKLTHRTTGHIFSVEADSKEEARAKVAIHTPRSLWNVEELPVTYNPDEILDEQADALIKGEGGIV